MAASGGRTRRKKTKKKSSTSVWMPLAGIVGAALLVVLLLKHIRDRDIRVFYLDAFKVAREEASDAQEPA